MGNLFRTSIRWKLAALVVGIVALTAVTFGVIGYRSARGILIGQVYDRLAVLRANRQRVLLNYIEQQQDLLRLVSSRTRLRELLEAYNAGRLSEKALREQTKPILEDAQVSCASFQALWVADPKGLVVTATAENFLWKDFAASPEFQQGRSQPFVGLIHNSDGKHQVVAVAPALGRHGEFLGMVMALLDARGVVAAMADPTGLGRTGEVVLGARVGDRVHYLVPPRHPAESQNAALDKAPALAAALRGESGFIRTRDLRGIEVLAAFGPLGYGGWGVVAKLDLAEAYAAVYWLRWLFVALVVALIGVGALAADALARRFARPICAMVRMADAIGDGSMDARVQVQSGDEVGRLGAAFNHMAEALAQSYGALEQRVRERTAALVQERHLLQSLMDHLPDHIYFKDRSSRFLRVNKALAQLFGVKDPKEVEGKSDFDYFTPEHAQAAYNDEQHLMNTGQPVVGKEEKETWPSGPATWVSTTKVPFRDEEGKVVGSFGISRDITQRKLAEEKLAHYARELAARNRQMEEDLAMAREVQLAFLPQHYPTFPAGTSPAESTIQFSHLYQPASSLGGDFFEIVPLSATTAGVLICDVMGHGVRSALVMAMIRGLVDELRPYAGLPSRFLKEINQALTSHLSPATTTIFVSACYVVLDAASGQLRCAAAGHPSPLWLRPDHGSVEVLLPDGTAHGPVLGLLPDANYPTVERAIAVNDAILLYTDGLYEVEGADGELYGQERLRAKIEELVQLPSDQLQARLVAEAQRFSNTGELTDDVCLVSMRLAHLPKEKPASFQPAGS